MNATILKLVIALSTVLPELVDDLKKTAADAHGATDPQTKIKNLVGDVELVLQLALKVL